MLADVAAHIDNYRMDLAAQALYEFTWNELCDWYLELSKPTLQSGSPAERSATRHTLLHVLETTLRALHPFMPFITEEIWQRVREPLGLQGESIMIQAWPQAGAGDPAAEQEVTWLQQVLQGIRRIRAELNLAPNLSLTVELQAGEALDRERLGRFESLLQSLGRVSEFRWIDPQADISKSAVALVGGLRVLIPLEGLVDVEAETARVRKLLDSELKDLGRSRAKMGNAKFVENAPAEVVDLERERLAQHQARVAQFEAQLERLARLAE